MTRASRVGRVHEFFTTYTKDLTADDLQRLFTRDTREAYRYLTRGVRTDAFNALPWHKRTAAEVRVLFMAFTMKLSPARRAVYGVALVLAAFGAVALFRGIGLLRVAPAMPFGVDIAVPGPVFQEGTWALLIAFGLVNLLALLEVADRLTLKNDLEIAREIQQSMLPSGLFRAAGVETAGVSRPANTVGGDFYDIVPLGDGRVAIAVGDVAGKGSPAALLMALAMAMLRTLIDQRLEPGDLVSRLNAQICRHAPGTRFITMFYAVYAPATGDLTYVNAGHTRPLWVRHGRGIERLTEGGVALGMFDGWTYAAATIALQPDELVAVYSDGITEAETPAGQPFDESGLESVLSQNAGAPLSDISAAVVGAVERHSADTRLADDLTILLLRRTTIPATSGV